MDALIQEQGSGDTVSVYTLRAQGQCYEFAKEWMKGTHVVVSLSSSRAPS